MTCCRAGVAALLLFACASPGFAQTDAPELRALWVDAFHEAIRSAREADDLVAAATRANINTLFVQVRRRGDALYTKGVEPPLDDPAYDPSFDALAYIVEAGHKGGLQVHAWVNAMPVWRDDTPPRDPRHVFNRHGPSATGDRRSRTRVVQRVDGVGEAPRARTPARGRPRRVSQHAGPHARADWPCTRSRQGAPRRRTMTTSW